MSQLQAAYIYGRYCDQQVNKRIQSSCSNQVEALRAMNVTGTREKVVKLLTRIRVVMKDGSDILKQKKVLQLETAGEKVKYIVADISDGRRPLALAVNDTDQDEVPIFDFVSHIFERSETEKCYYAAVNAGLNLRGNLPKMFPNKLNVTMVKVSRRGDIGIDLMNDEIHEMSSKEFFDMRSHGKSSGRPSSSAPKHIYKAALERIAAIADQLTDEDKFSNCLQYAEKGEQESYRKLIHYIKENENSFPFPLHDDLNSEMLPGKSLQGITKSMIYLGYRDTAFGAHLADLNQHSIIRIHHGEKILCIVPDPKDVETFNDGFGSFCISKKCRNTTQHFRSFLPFPKACEELKIHVDYVLLKPGMTFFLPRGCIHYGINLGMSLSESVNFIDIGWFDSLPPEISNFSKGQELVLAKKYPLSVFEKDSRSCPEFCLKNLKIFCEDFDFPTMRTIAESKRGKLKCPILEKLDISKVCLPGLPHSIPKRNSFKKGNQMQQKRKEKEAASDIDMHDLQPEVPLKKRLRASHDQRERARVKELKTKNKTLRKENEALQKKLNVRLESENDALRLCVEVTRSENQAAEVPVQKEKKQPQPSPEKLKRQDLLQNLKKKQLSKERRLSHSDSEEETPGRAQFDSEDEDLDSDNESVADDSRSFVSEYEEAPKMEIDPEPPMILTEVAQNSPRPPPPASPAPSTFLVELKPVFFPENFQSSRIPNILDDIQYEIVAGQLEGLMGSQKKEPAASKGENISESLTTPKQPPAVTELTDSDDDDEQLPAPRQEADDIKKPTPHPIKVPDTPEDIKRWSTEVHFTGEPRLAMEKGYLKHKMELYELIYKSKLVSEYIHPEILNVDDNLEDADDYTGLRREHLDKFLSACRRKANLCKEKIVFLNK